MSATDTLKQLMTTAGIPSYRALAARAGVSMWAVQQLRGDRLSHMRLATLQRLAAALTLPLPELLHRFQGTEAQPGASGSSAPLTADYDHLQAQLRQQESLLRQRFQREVLTTLETWLVQWPTVVQAVTRNPDLPASRVVPLVQPLGDLLAQWGVEAIAPVGAILPYDPQHHELLAGHALPGALVKVRYTGFRQGETLLYRAQVSPVEGG
ncbi:MAG TPA: helix-turn-helix transcriptional regulator [Candidatus Obscuribacterales bacterium]